MIKNMEKLLKLQKQLADKQILIYQESLIEYFTGIKFSVGERFIGLYVNKEKAVFIVNKLFDVIDTKGIKAEYFFDGENYGKLIEELLLNKDLFIDGNIPYMFTLKLTNLGINLYDGSEIINDIIAIKSDNEVSLMQKSSELNDRVMADVLEFLKEGISEKEVYNFILNQFKKYQADDVSFNPIVAFGENCADPHAESGDRKLMPGDTVIVDMGCILNGYCSDMTRSFVFENHEFSKIYDIVLRASQLAKEKIKVGVKFSEIDKAARDYITQQGYGEYFNHRLGHGCGKIVHEPYDVSQATDKKLEENMIFSIEPGIYIKGKGGIRIEDLVVVKKSGCVSLNKFPYDKKLNNKK